MKNQIVTFYTVTFANSFIYNVFGKFHKQHGWCDVYFYKNPET